MTANQTPIFCLTPNVGKVQVTVANTNRDGTGTLATLWASGASGSQLFKVALIVPATATADVVRLFWTNGADTKLWKEIAVPAQTISGTAAATTQEIVIVNTPEVYPTGWTLSASTHNGQATNLFAFGGDY